MEAPKAKPRSDKGVNDLPERRCIASGQVRPNEDLIRFVLDPDGRVTPDLEEKLPGRGMWVSADRASVEKAAAKSLFAKSAKRSVTVADDLAARLEALLLKRCQQRFGLARKAGLVTLGFEKTKAALQAATGGALIEAADASADQAAKIRAMAPSLVVIDGLSRAELGHALGRENPVHGYLSPGTITDGLVRDARRLKGFRGCQADQV